MRISRADDRASVPPPSAQRGKQIAESGMYEPPRGEYLGTIDLWGVDVYENAPREWIDTLFAEAAQQETAC